jgi:hypothetical protein
MFNNNFNYSIVIIQTFIQKYGKGAFVMAHQPFDEFAPSSDSRA